MADGSRCEALGSAAGYQAVANSEFRKNPSGSVCGLYFSLAITSLAGTEERMSTAAKLDTFRLAPPRAVRARYDRRRRRVIVRFSTGLDVSFSPRDAQGLEKATAAQLERIEISPSGYGIRFPKIGADIYMPALLLGFLGSRNWIAGRLGALGGKSRSAAKIAAAKRNGRRGGRPRKHAVAAGSSKRQRSGSASEKRPLRR